MFAKSLKNCENTEQCKTMYISMQVCPIYERETKSLKSP